MSRLTDAGRRLLALGPRLLVAVAPAAAAARKALSPVARLVRRSPRLVAFGAFLFGWSSRAGAVLFAVAGAGMAIRSSHWLWLPAGLVLHVLAAFLATAAARRRRGAPLPVPERNAVLYLALFVPVVGPSFAWSLPRKEERTDVQNAHEVMLQYEEHVKPKVPEYERSLFTGDFERDLARKLDTESYREVLRHGDTDQKRSALFRLAELGEPHHLALIRGCLEDEDQEVRLYAYGELDRLVRGYEDAIGAARHRVKEDENDFEAHLALAEAHFGLAVSGVLDSVTGKFHLRGAIRSGTRAKELSTDPTRPALLLARAHARLSEVEEAGAVLDALSEAQREDPEVCLTRAEVAFLARDFHRAREEAGRLILLGAEMPGWLMALCVADDTAPPEEDEAAPAEADADAEGTAAASEEEAPDADADAAPPERETDLSATAATAADEPDGGRA